MRIAMAVVMMMALGLAACGKKGPLQPPPAEGEAVERPRPLF